MVRSDIVARAMRYLSVAGWLLLLAPWLLAACGGDRDRASSAPPTKQTATSTERTQGERPKRLASRESQDGRVAGGDQGLPSGRWRKRRTDDDAVAPWQTAQAERLEALGYVSGSQEAKGQGGVRLLADGCYDGYNFYVSGHAPMAALMDMEGNLLHEWKYAFGKAWPHWSGPVDPSASQFWRRAHLYQNGDLLAIFAGLGMIKIDRDSRLIWKSARGEHHDLEVMSNGDIYVLTRQRHVVPSVNARQPIVEDSITQLDANGHALRSISLLDCLRNSPYLALWDRSRLNKGDIFHTNAIRILDKSLEGNEAFKKGRALISMLRLHAVALVDLDERRIVWARPGEFRAQHDAQIVGGGHLMLFDNRGGNPRNGRSRILEYTLPDMRLVWTYEGTPREPFFSITCGAAQRLPNGNTLIAETDNGRAFEVTRDKRIVWEFVSPHRAGAKRELVASLFDLKRIPKSSARWLGTPKRE